MIEVRIDINSSNLEVTQEYIEKAVSNHTQAWKFIFTSLGLDVNDQKYIRSCDLCDYSSKITKSILFMYSMETFLPYALNKAERVLDKSKV